MEDALEYDEYRRILVKSSHRRCADDFKLQRGEASDINVLTSSEVQSRRSSLTEYLSSSANIINAVRDKVRQGNYCVMISDDAGVIVDLFADAPASEEYSDFGLSLGSVMSESLVGTNGIGTCLTSKSGVTISGTDHFSERFSSFTCTGAPIHAADGRIVGVLNISRRVNPGYIENFFTHSFIMEAAKQVSANIFLSEFSDLNILSFSQYDTVQLYDSKALLAIDDAGLIQGATRSCVDLMHHVDQEQIIGQKLSDFIYCSIDDIFNNQSRVMKINEGFLADNFVTGFRLKVNQGVKPISRKGRVKKSALPIKKSMKRKAGSRQPSDGDMVRRFSGSDKGVQSAVDIGLKLVDQDIPLLILGETGVGKDTLANLLHKNSNRASHPFVALNCAALPPTLMESELFGYVAGTFTDGLKDGKVGKILSADKGILFLDEIGDMPLDLQVLFLRVLEERQVTPLGAVEPIPVDMRIICATNKDMTELVEQGKFRRDLYYRIMGAEIYLSPLRERTNFREIVMELIRQDGDRDIDALEIEDNVWGVLENYSWPGNIRELKSTLKYALCICSDNKITVQDLPKYFMDSVSNDPAKDVGGMPESELSSENRSLNYSKSVAEHQLVKNALKKHGWNVTSAADELNISRSTLHRKIRKYNILSPNKKEH